MSVKRSRPGTHAVKTGREVGPDYPTDRFTNPFNAGLDATYGNGEDKTLKGPTSTPEGEGPLRKEYDELWEGK